MLHFQREREKKNIFKFLWHSVDWALIIGPEENSFALLRILILYENKTISQGIRNCIFCYVVQRNKGRRNASGIQSQETNRFIDLMWWNPKIGNLVIIVIIKPK